MREGNHERSRRPLRFFRALDTNPNRLLIEVVRYPEFRFAGSYETFSAHEQRRLESNVGEICPILATIDVSYGYPQVPSCVGEERNVIDRWTITTDGRFVVD